MYTEIASASMFGPDLLGLNRHNITGDQLALIKQKLQEVYLVSKDPEVPAKGIPSDFFLVYQAVRRGGSDRMNSIMQHQEDTLFILWGTLAVKLFLAEHCGIT